jgi:two-component sensor histidine kinase
MAMRHTKDAGAARLLQASRSRVRVIALSHATAWRDEDMPSAAGTRAYLEQLVGEAVRSRAAGERIQAELATNDVTLGPSEIVAVALCVNELVANALDHAFPEGRHGFVRVTLSREGDFVTVRVADDGIGMPDGAGDAGKGLGLALLRLLAEQLSATTTLVSSAGHGTDFCLRFSSTEESRAWQTS